MKIKLDHYSKEKRTVIDPKFMGSNHAGEETKRPERVPRLYWYRHDTKPEYVFKNHVRHTWEGELDLYDIALDKDGLVEGQLPNIWEGNLVVGGYDGYFSSEFYPEIIAVFKRIEL